jgi:hypothetical protein
VVLAVVSIGSNSRALVLIGTISVCLIMAYGFITRTLPMRLFRPRRLVLIGLALALQGPVSDLATSMVIARAQRNVPASQLISATIETMQDQNAIRERRLADVNDDHATWDERYLDNVFLAPCQLEICRPRSIWPCGKTPRRAPNCAASNGSAC